MDKEGQPAQLGEAFLQGAQRGGASPPMAGVDSWSKSLAKKLEALDESRSAIEVHAEDFAAFLGGLFAEHAGERDPTAWLEACHLKDLYLAFRCIGGDDDALATFDESYRPMASRIAEQFEQSEYAPPELVQLLWEHLLVDSPQNAARLAQYAGSGSLKSWLRVTATRFFIDLLRTGSQRAYEETDFDDALLERMPDEDDDQELRLLKKKYRHHFKIAFQRAFEELSGEQRNLLRQRIVGELTVRQIGSLYGVHASTISRRLALIRQQLLETTRQLLKGNLEIDSSELDSIMRLIDSDFEVSLHRLLTDEDGFR